MSQGYVRWVYLVVDVSGSTRRDGLNNAVNQAMPHIVDGLAAQPGAGIQLAVLAAGHPPRSVLGLTPVARIEMIPQIQPERLCLLSPAIEQVATVLAADLSQVQLDDPAADQHRTQVTVLLIGDGSPADPAESLHEAFRRLRDVPPSVTLRCSCVVVGDVLRVELATLADQIAAAPTEPAILASRIVHAAIARL